MPKALEEKLKRTARKKFGSTKSPRARAYIWGNPTMKAWRKKGK